MDITTKVLEDRPFVGSLEQVPRSLVEAKRVSQLIDILASADIHPQQLRPSQAAGSLREIIEVVNLISVKQNRTRHRSLFPCKPLSQPCLVSATASASQPPHCPSRVGCSVNRCVGPPEGPQGSRFACLAAAPCRICATPSPRFAEVTGGVAGACVWCRSSAIQRGDRACGGSVGGSYALSEGRGLAGTGRRVRRSTGRPVGVVGVRPLSHGCRARDRSSGWAHRRCARSGN